MQEKQSRPGKRARAGLLPLGREAWDDDPSDQDLYDVLDLLIDEPHGIHQPVNSFVLGCSGNNAAFAHFSPCINPGADHDMVFPSGSSFHVDHVLPSSEKEHFDAKPFGLKFESFRPRGMQQHNCTIPLAMKLPRAMVPHSPLSTASTASTQHQFSDPDPDHINRSIALNPRDFQQICRALGADVITGPDHTTVRLAENQVAFFPPRADRLGKVEHERTYIMSGEIPVKERRRHDVFSDRPISDSEKSFWCDQGNAHCVLDTAKPLRVAPGSGQHINPRTIQVAHALASRVSHILPSEKPIIKCYYYSLHRRSVNKRKRVKGGKTKASADQNTSLGIHKHIYVLCDQNVDKRHSMLEGSQIWLVRYFLKGNLDPSMKDLISIPEEIHAEPVAAPKRANSGMSL